MKSVKKVEIIIDAQVIPRILEQLANLGVGGYSVIKEVSGRGDRGTRTGDSLSGAFDNSYVMVACSEEEARRIVEMVRPILKRYGGVCLVSDAMWVIH